MTTGRINQVTIVHQHAKSTPAEPPKGRMSRTGVAAHDQPATCTPQEEEAFADSRSTRRGLVGGAAPKGLEDIWHSQQSTNQKWRPLMESSGTSGAGPK
ncbi:hypothetical protein PTT_01476 [Pyrenophora teres f. teres 0-1]|uniref:Uncharacterized protein n=1 Tax=Pyrenophora teres f. teres (strain 0-1) TaxID=861557 RepID=E3RD20_PYRTT|nr:hypothetical protein PTT_01476 [Pyrenophora teres f. teres 0-1]